MEKTPTLLYRVAHMSTICTGLYESGTAIGQLCNPGRHPMPYDDAKLEHFYNRKFRCTMRFAFGSLDQLRFWIYSKEIRAKLSEQGFVIYMIEPLGERGEDWQIGDTQAIFSEHREVGILNLEDI